MATLTSLLNILSDHPPLVRLLPLLPQRCLRKRLNTNNCQLCLESCNEDALGLKGREITLYESRCTGCMLCVSACPQDALSAECDLDELLDSLIRVDHVRVSCVRRKNLYPKDTIVPCFGIFSKPLLAALGLSDCGSITFNLVGCSVCPNSNASEVFLDHFKEITKDYVDLLKTDLAIMTTEEEIKKPEVDRRSYLSNVKRLFNDVSKNSIAVGTRAEPQAKQNRYVPFKTKLIRNLIHEIEPAARPQLVSHFSHDLIVNKNCTLCPLCKGICPTGAITMKRSEQGKELYFTYLDCNGCGLCVEFCKKDALILKQFIVAPPTDQAIKLK